IYSPMAGRQREKGSHVVLQLPQIQEFVAEARERHALMTTRRARGINEAVFANHRMGRSGTGSIIPFRALHRNEFGSEEHPKWTRNRHGWLWTTSRPD